MEEEKEQDKKEFEAKEKSLLDNASYLRAIGTKQQEELSEAHNEIQNLKRQVD